MDEESIFLRAVDFANPDERMAFLDAACGDDHRLRASVESLLKHHTAAGPFLEVPPAALQQTIAECPGDTVEDDARDPWVKLLAPCEQPGRIGQLGPYEIIEIIGRGGMGVVLRARDPKLNRDVAVKVLAAGVPHLGVAQRFLREAQSAAAVKHDHVITIHSVNDQDRLPYFVMELVEGISLQQKIDRNGALELDEILRIGSQIAAGLDAAHRRGLVHRDIKPANILLEAGTERVKITDFGVARAVDDGHLTREGQIVGTPQFMSPEQAQGKKADHRSDLFSLGSVLYAMCTGRPPFSAETAVATLRGICDDAPTPIRQLNKNVPEWLDEFVVRLLEKDPNQRPQSARDVADLLSVQHIHRPASAAPAIDDHYASAAHRNRWMLASAAAITLAGVIIVVMSRDGKTTRVEVPDGAEVRVTTAGAVEVELPNDRPEKQPSLPTFSLPQQLQAVVAQLVQLNPGFDGQVTPTILNDEVVELQFSTDQVEDISPVKALANLQNLVCSGSARDSSPLADLSPLRGMALHSLDCANTQVFDLTPLKGLPLTRLSILGTEVVDLSPLTGLPLERLNCAHTRVANLAPLKSMPLTELYVQDTPVMDLSPLRGMPLKHLNFSSTQVTDLSPLQGMPLVSLYCDATQVTDLSPLAGMPLERLNWRGYDQTNANHQKIVRAILTLEMIDSLHVDEFWRGIDGKSQK
jgi:tRNA A-37 threonylcarbamoyl transferase component Bud32